MPSDALTRLLNATRPYKKFEVEIEGEKVELYARRPGSIESAQVSRAFEEAYAESKKSQTAPDYTSLYTLLKRQEPERLAEFIVKADNRDYLQEASYLNNEAPLDDIKVIEDAKGIAATKLEEYKALSHDDLMNKSWERREHFQAVEDGQTASNYMMAVVTLYDKDSEGKYNPLFASVEEAKGLPITALVEVLTKAFETIGEASDSPLKSAPKTSSDAPTLSPDATVEESPSPTSSGP